MSDGATAMDRQVLNEALHTLDRLTVDRLKLVLRGINQSPLWNADPVQKMTGLKADLVQRVKLAFLGAFNDGNQGKFAELKKIVSESASAPKTNHHTAAQSTSHGNPPQTNLQCDNARFDAQQRDMQEARQAQLQRAQLEQERLARSQYNQHYAHAPPPPPAPPVHPPPPPPALPAPRWGPGANAGAPVNGAGANGQNGVNQPARVETMPIRFRPNPFFRVEKSLSAIATCVRAGQGDRKTVAASFALTDSQRVLLSAAAASSTAPQYQVRLFSTNEDFFNQSRSSAAQNPVPIDFPPVVEVRLNHGLVTANMKGIKKQIGTSPPADLSSTKALSGGLALSLTPGYINRLEIVYGSTEKKYFLIVYLVEVFSVTTLFTKIKTTKVRSKEDVIASIVKQNSDPDFEASSMGLSLKDPLTLARIKVPIRSISCNHVSCFDASTFLMINEQTPSWKCPICSNVLRYEDLAVDGYLQDILRICPSSVDEVTVEPDGRWRSSDNQHGTAPPRPSRAGTEDSLNAATEKGKAKALDQDALTIDSDDDDRPLIRNRLLQLDGSRPTSRASTEAPKRSETIDLTLSDSEDEQDDVVLYNGQAAPPVVPPPRLPEQRFTPPPFADPYGDVRALYAQGSMENAAAKRALDEAESNQAKRQREY